ncbi:MAG: prephenate dehydrogenase/arogenate dehydrogenase family protein, partial [Longimicrobiales bacterium]|nr:prephenate dehydrogenase/arogenate dehydrogenase family protein [Longimicrobiales bacterium]
MPPPSEGPLGRVAVLGLGLMGGSLARGVSMLGLARRVTGWSPRSTERDAALTAGAVTLAAADWSEAVSDADLVVLAVPLGPAVELVQEVRDAIPASATLTDVVSLKAPVEAAVRRSGLEDQWVGSHPMVGGEASGFWASRSDLYQGATVWVV